MLCAVDQNGRDDRVIISTHSAAAVPPNVPEQVNQAASSRRNIANYLSQPHASSTPDTGAPLRLHRDLSGGIRSSATALGASHPIV
jgi:hypothetical protein